jgi:hypothetical protein
MSDEYEWKFGDWLENDAKERCRIIDITADLERVQVRVIFNNGSISPWCNACCFTHLPNCDSWNWQPPLQLKEGCWYERRDGEIVGPCKNGTGKDGPWLITPHWYRDDGTNTWEPSHLVREVSAPTPPAPIEPPPGYRLLSGDEVIADGDFYLSKNGCWFDSTSIGALVKSQIEPNNARAYARKLPPKYRPFKDASEFEPHRAKYVKSGNIVSLVLGYDNRCIVTVHQRSNVSFDAAFNLYTFENGEPFGVREQ